MNRKNTYLMVKQLLGGTLSLGLALQPALVGAHEGEPDQPVGHAAKALQLSGDNPITFGAGLTMVGQGMSGNSDDSGFTYSADLAFTGDFGPRGTAFIYINTAQGTGIDTGAATGSNADNETGDLSAEGYSETRIAEAWYELPLNEMASVRFGKIDPTGIYDGNMVANDETSQFLADTFVNNAAIAFPGYTGGINLAVNPNEAWSINVGVFESSGDFDGSLSNSFIIGEVGFAGELAGRPGHLRFTGWSEDSTKNKGYALSVDQTVSDSITLFARYGNQDDEQNFDNAFSLGGQLALGGNTVGAAYSLLTTTDLAGPDDESQIELYYNHAVNENLHVTLDLQSISNPGFDSSNDDVFVYGVRGQIDF